MKKTDNEEQKLCQNQNLTLKKKDISKKNVTKNNLNYS